VIKVPATAVLLAHTPEEIRAEARRALTLLCAAIDRRDHAQADRIRAHVTAYAWLLGETDVAPVTGRRVPALTARDLSLEQAPGRDHAEQNTHRYNDPARVFPEAVFDAIAWARGEFDEPPSDD
jgi:hypothetical protein